MSTIAHGMHHKSGCTICGLDHLKQSIQDILTTPIGSRVMRRDYGSRLMELVDQPLNAATLTRLYGATAEALQQWEPRFTLEQTQAEVDAGKVTLTVTGKYLGQTLKVGVAL